MDYFADVIAECVVCPDVCLHTSCADEWPGDAPGMPTQDDERHFSESGSEAECVTLNLNWTVFVHVVLAFARPQHATDTLAGR